MRRSLLLSGHSICLLVGVVVWPVVKTDRVTRALSSIERGSWNKSVSTSSDTSSKILAVASPSLNATGLGLWISPNSSSEQALWPPLNTYNNVSFLLSDREFVPKKNSVDTPNYSFRTNVYSGMITVSATGRKPLISSSITQGRYITWSTARIAFGHASLSALLGCLLQRYYPSF